MGGYLTTKCRHLFFSSGFILLLFFFLIQSARAQETGTVITKSGDKYENVVIKMHRTLSIISVERDTLKNIINFEEIVKILDADGSDITAEIKKWHSSGVKGIWKAEGDWISIQRRKQLWKAGLRLAANLSIPLARNHMGLASGIGYEGTYHYTILNEIALRFTYSKSGLRGDQAYTSELYSHEYKFSASRFRVGVQYHKQPVAMLTGKMIPYFYTEFGIIWSKTTSQTFLYDNEADSYESFSYKEKKFTTNQGGGIIILISKKVGLDFGVEYNTVFGAESMVDYGAVLDFKLGLIALL